MSYRMYPVGFGHVVASVKVLKAVEYFASYEDARKAVIDHRNKPDTNKYSVVQLGYDNKAELMVYKPECASWTITNPCWTKEEFGQHGKVRTLRVPLKNTKDQRLKLGWGWDKAVVELFSNQFGIKFFDLNDKWQSHYKSVTKDGCLEYSCVAPEDSVRTLTKSYGCTVI